jgi:nicotinamidase-related amidase
MSQPDGVTHPMAIAREQAAIVLIDVQERLFPVMDADHREEVMRNLKILAAAARRLSVPMLVTEQYPKGLGHTLQELKEALPTAVEPIEKVAFSCWAVDTFRARLTASGARQVILAGIEAHVCVLMSALDLLAGGHGVQIVADAVTSRTQANWRLAMDYLRQAGAVVTTTETVLFQLLRQADSDDFRELARLIR